MNFSIWFDIIFISLIVILGIKGLIRGLVKEIFGLIGIIGGIIIASRFSLQAGEFVNNNIYKFDNPAMGNFVGFISLLICFWLLSLLIGVFLSKLISLSGLGLLDKIGGFLVGSGKIFLIVSVIVSILSNIQFIDDSIKPIFEKSKVYPVLLKSGNWIANIDSSKITQDIPDKVESAIEELK